ncbi:hypothetical protein PIB30_081329 [Stylosanthes scabra]|uniref:Uncharacterized protein n=1 Tax=Stylosanthes scabra TaxID=79078 RepID=A0ABU6SRU3_9FABA|nr:hypothetical protein [Stylosanthes scabra]
MARDGPSPSAKGKAKVRTLPTRVSPRLTAQRAQASTPSPATIFPPAVPTPAVARRTAQISAKGGPSNVAPTNRTPLRSAVTPS